ncbi:FAD-binding domain protein [Ceratobasidium sp. AG-Ba]|nr:FAD-binding domain protein [Ceratobasidium sp. AG-Ba]
MAVDTPMRLPPDDDAVRELKRLVKGTVHARGDSGYVRHSQLFNAAIRTSAHLLVRPLDAHDVSEVVKFCNKHNLSISAKSGGYGTHGWSVEGDVILDMRLVAQITMERPGTASPDWTSLRDVPHVPVKDPDMLKGKGRMPSASAYPNTYPSGVGPPPIHAPFTDPRRRSADEAFSPSPIAIIPPSSSPPHSDGVDNQDRMVIDGVDGIDGFHNDHKANDHDGFGSERPSRRLRVTSPSSGRGSSHTDTSTGSTPPTTESPDTPAEMHNKIPASPPSQSENGKTRGPVTADEVQHDEGMLPPAADRPGVGVDIRGFVGRDVGGWDTVWNGGSTRGAAAESVGVSYAMGEPPSGMGANMGSSAWLWAPPPAAGGATTVPNAFPPAPRALTSPALTSTRSPPRSNGPPNARPFDFSDSTPTPTQVNAFINPHAAQRPPTPGTNSVPPRPFDFGPTGGNENGNSPAPGSPPPALPSSSTLLPTVTHVPFAPAPPLPHTYVTFGAGASQKDVDAFCAAHPLAAVVAPSNTSPTTDGVDGTGSRVDSIDGAGPKVDGVDGHGPTIVADSARPELYERPSGRGFGPGSGSFFAPGMSSLPSPSPAIPYFVPFAAHPVGPTVMLLGGFGFLSRLHGLSMDCLVEAEVVLSDGRIVWVSKEGVRGEDGELLEEEDDGEGWVDGEGDVLEPEENQDGDKSDPQEVDGEGATDKGKEKEKEAIPPSTTPAQPDGKDEPKPKRGLWWALRGAGPAFGIVVRYKAKAFPVPVVFAGNLIYNFNKLTAASLIKHFRDCIKSAPRELYANCILTAGPKNKGALVVIQICYAGSRADGLPFLQAISSWEGEGCLLNEVQEKEFVWQQDSIAKVLKGGSGRKWFIRSDLISSLTDEIIHQTVRKFGDTPDGCTWLFELSGGALMDTTDSCLPKVAREAAFTIVALHQWKLEQNDPACVLTAEQWIKESLAPQSTGGPFPCFLERREKRSRILGVYGRDNWARLCALKKKYDPNGRLKHNFWPLDEDGMPIVDPKLMKENKTGLHATDLTLDDRGVPVPT